MTEIVWGVAVFLWTMATFFARMPEQRTPLFSILGLEEEWEERCQHIHGRAERGLRTIYGVLAAAATLAAVVGTNMHIGIQYAAVSLLLALATIAAGPRAAGRWERAAQLRLRDWLLAAEASKYRVNPIPPPKT